MTVTSALGFGIWVLWIGLLLSVLAVGIAVVPRPATTDSFSCDPCGFIDRYLTLNERGQPWTLSPHQRHALRLMLRFDASARLTSRLVLWSEPKKSGKTMLAACLAIWWAVTRSPTEVTCLANDLEQSQGRVFATVVALLKHNGFESGGLVKITATEVRFRTGSIIRALASDFKGEAGGRQTLAIFDEPWGFTSERATRLWEEFTPIPTVPEAWVLAVTTAGFLGESALLEGLYQRGLAMPRIDGDLEIHQDGEFSMLWSHTPRQPWQTGEAGARYYREQRRSLRPATYLRLHENRWVAAESTFITEDLWDSNIVPDSHPLLYFDGEVVVGVDGGLKSDNLAVQCVGWLPDGRLRHVTGRIWRPLPGVPLDLEATVEAYLREVCERYTVAIIRYDPWQLARSMATLRAEGLPCEEYVQSEQHVGRMGQALYDLLKGHNLVLYADLELRQQALNTVAVEKPSGGYHIRKVSGSRKIDGIVALSMACVAALDRGPTEEMRLLFGASWQRQEGSAPSADTLPEMIEAEKLALWEVLRPLLVAIDNHDIAAFNEAAAAVERHVAAVEADDPKAGARLWATLSRVEEIVTGEI